MEDPNPLLDNAASGTGFPFSKRVCSRQGASSLPFGIVRGESLKQRMSVIEPGLGRLHQEKVGHGKKRDHTQQRRRQRD